MTRLKNLIRKLKILSKNTGTDKVIQRYEKIPQALRLLQDCLEADLRRGKISGKDYRTLIKATSDLLRAIMYYNCGFEVHKTMASSNTVRQLAKAENRLWQVYFVHVPIKMEASPAADDIL